RAARDAPEARPPEPGAAGPERAEAEPAEAELAEAEPAKVEPAGPEPVGAEPAAAELAEAEPAKAEPAGAESPADELREKLKRLPDRPGVYIFKNVAGEPIYVGKAVSLRNRVRSYFTSLHTQSAKVRVMAAQIADLDFIVTDSEVEAL